MENKVIHKLIEKVKDKFTKNDKNSPVDSEYVFSTLELKEIEKQNKQKILDLKQDVFLKKKREEKEEGQEEIVALEKEELLDSDDNLEKSSSEVLSLEKKEEEHIKHSFINLDETSRSLIMEKWNLIEVNDIEKDIINAKEILNHNYTITYADDAARFIHNIRKKYEVVICYLVGFNNEKKGVFDKTIFSSRIDDEWKYLSQYIKVLEKIRNFKSNRNN